MSKHIHPECHKAYKDNEAILAFMNMLASDNPIPNSVKYIKKDAPPTSSYLYKLNEFVVAPTHVIDVEWKQENGKPKILTLTLVNENSKTYLVTYISDYILKTYKK